MNTLIHLLPRLYALGLRLYPRAFYALFAEEMVEIYRIGLAHAARAGTVPTLAFAAREGLDLLRGVSSEHWIALRADVSTPGRYATADTDRPSSWVETWAGASLFLVTGAALIVPVLFATQTGPVWVVGMRVLLLLGLVIAPSVGFAVGWISGFPRWSYPFVLLTALVHFTLMNDGPLADELALHWWRGQVNWLPWLPCSPPRRQRCSSLVRCSPPSASLPTCGTIGRLTWGMFGAAAVDPCLPGRRRQRRLAAAPGADPDPDGNRRRLPAQPRLHPPVCGAVGRRLSCGDRRRRARSCLTRE
ncbi:MAG: hypothetical protein R2873_34470 [Caldilineaceae bacterium]